MVAKLPVGVWSDGTGLRVCTGPIATKTVQKAIQEVARVATGAGQATRKWISWSATEWTNQLALLSSSGLFLKIARTPDVFNDETGKGW